MTIAALSAGMAGLHRASTRFASGAEHISRVGTQTSEIPSVDIAREAIGCVEARLAFEASAAVVRVADDMQGQTLDMWV